MDDLTHAPRRLPQVSGRLIAVAVALAVILGSGALYLQRRGSASSSLHYATARVTRGDISAGVQETGPIAAATAVPLNFKNSGKVSEIDVKAGDQVQVGQTLAKLDPSDLQTQLRQSQANLDAVQASYNKLLQGATQADTTVAQAAVDAASLQLSDAQAQAAQDANANQRALDNTGKNLRAVQAQVAAATAADKAMVQGAQQTLADAQKQLNALAPVIAQQLATAKAKLYADQTTWDAQVGRGAATKEQRQSALDADQSAIDQAVAAGQQQTVAAQTGVNQAQTALNSASAALQNDLAKLQGQLTIAQTQVDAAQDALGTAAAKDRAQINAAVSALQTAKANYGKTVQPPTQADLDNAKALVAAQQAQLELAQANLDAAVLTSPTNGVITAVNGAVGQWLTGGSISGQAASAASGANTAGTSSSNSSNFISLTDLSGLQVDAQVNEADVGRVKPGQAVKFTIDAFPGQTFAGKVAVVQPLGTSSNNVVTYTVTIDINPTTVQLLPGMTANVTILTTSVPDTLIVPSAAISFGQTQGASGSAAGVQPKPAASSGPQASTGASPPTSAGPRPAGIATVIVVVNGKGTPRQVQIGVSDDRNTQVLSGLNPGDEVATGTAAS